MNKRTTETTSKRRDGRGRLRAAMRRLSGAMNDSRRGSVILLAVGVLAVLAVLALSYVTVARLDRASSQAYANSVNFQQQVNAVVGEMQALLTADLFGNKIVTGSTPSSVNGNRLQPVWPKMFEDGEYRDYPTTALVDETTQTTFDEENDDMPPTPSATLTFRFNGSTGRFETAPADDAWLASTFPVRRTETNFNDIWTMWPQITNLRSAYRYVGPNDRSGIPNEGAWVRDDGKFVDLGQFAQQSLPGSPRTGNPGADLSEFNFDNEVSAAGAPSLPGAANQDAKMGLWQEVFVYQMDRLAEKYLNDNPLSAGEADQLSHADTRYWADTDGDTFPDARWQQLDVLGDLFGLRWVVAARIVDNSALVNVNTATRFGRFAGDIFGDGITPADVDLERLLAEAVGAVPFSSREPHFEVSPNFDAGFAMIEHLQNGLRVNDMFEQIDQSASDSGNQLTDLLVNNWRPGQDRGPFGNINGVPLFTRPQREALYTFFGASPGNRRATAGVPYPIGDEVDLRAYNGFNYEPILSKLEQRLDGPEDEGWLPGGYREGDRSLGALRSDENLDESRLFSEIFPDGQSYTINEKINRLQRDVRRLLTTVSGVGPFSPVPPVSGAQDGAGLAFGGRFHNERVRLRDMARGNQPNPDAVQRAFESLVWALAPLATDQPVVGTLLSNDVGENAQDADNHYGGGDNGPAPADSNAAYAVLRAASLATNLADAVDNDELALFRPTVTRLFNDVDRGTADFELSTRFSHGDIPSASLPDEYVGAQENGVTLVGLDRQPFLMELSSVAAYHFDDVNNPMGADPITIVPSDPTNQLGGLIAVEIGNPWPTSIDLSNFRVRITDGTNVIELALDALAPSEVSSTIDAGQRAVVYYTDWDETNGEYNRRWADEYMPAWVDAIGNDARPIQLSADALIQRASPNDDDPVFFQDFAGAAGPATALLIYDPPDDGNEYLLDRMSSTDSGPFPKAEGSSFDLPTPVAPQVLVPVLGSGRRVYTASMRRNSESNALGGFPSYVIERPSENTAAEDGGFDQTWIATPDGVIEEMPADVLAIQAADSALLGEDKGVLDMPVPLPSFQLFVPNGPLAAVSELHQVSVFCHTYVHPDAVNPVSLSNADQGPNIVNGKWQGANGAQRWITVSEQLGLTSEMTTDNAATPNPYLGVLDPTRYIIGDDIANVLSGSNRLPESLRLPLALRVFDCFEALDLRDPLARGRININTAPEDVLELLPLWSRPVDIGPLMANHANAGLARTVREYRDFAAGPMSTAVSPSPDNPWTSGFFDNLAGYRDAPMGRQNGIFTTGELAVLHPWGGEPGAPVPMDGAGFMELGANNAPDNPTDSSYSDTIDLRRETSVPQQVVGGFDGVDDPEERLAIYRNVSNIASTRSDVFTAWFTLRGYDPERIDRLEINNPDDEREIFDFLKETRTLGANAGEEGLTPAYESRWMVVFDRSRVTRPTDRPRVLMIVELPTD